MTDTHIIVTNSKEKMDAKMGMMLFQEMADLKRDEKRKNETYLQIMDRIYTEQYEATNDQFKVFKEKIQKG